MKDWFPFTEYDFYSYLFSGLILLFGLDLWTSGGDYLFHDDWTFVGTSVVVALAYVMGQVISIPSSIILEHWIVRKILRPPALILLSDRQNSAEKFIEKYLIGRHYSPLPHGVVDKVFSHAMKDTGLSRKNLELDTKEVLVPAIIYSRRFEETKNRITFFRNQYGFSRNISFVGFILTVLFFYKFCTAEFSFIWPIIILAASICMFIRFLKFYSCCATEVINTYAYCKGEM